MSVSTGEYRLLYDPSEGEEERWYINDHTLVQAEDGWHLFGITHAEPAAPKDERSLVHWSGRTYYLFIGPDVAAMKVRSGPRREAYRTTRVIASDDPLRFRIEDLVGTIRSHAAEVVVADDGTDWVTHCGWGEGGLHAAPLRWHAATTTG